MGYYLVHRKSAKIEFFFLLQEPVKNISIYQFYFSNSTSPYFDQIVAIFVADLT